MGKWLKFPMKPNKKFKQKKTMDAPGMGRYTLNKPSPKKDTGRKR